jgi:hypothetical protein
MMRYLVKMGIVFADGTEMSVSHAVDADNEEGARDVARDQLRAIVLDDVDIVVYDAIMCEVCDIG